MKKLVAVLFLLLPLIFADTGGAGQLLPISAVFSSDPIYRSMLEQFPVEIKEFDQTQEAPSEVQKFQTDWQAFIKTGRALPPKWFLHHSWSKTLSGFFSRAAARQTSGPAEIDSLVYIEVPRVDLHQPHSIEDPDYYATERIGEKIVSEIKQTSLKTIVYGGNLDSLASALGCENSNVLSIPSPYEAWGLQKVFVTGAAFPDNKARFVMVIPPSRQYLVHYAQMFRRLGITVEKVILNTSDQKQQIHRLQEAFQQLQTQLSVKPDVIVLGYYNQFRTSPSGIKELTEEISIGEGLTVQLVEDSNQAKPLRYLLLRSDLTIWGESSAFIIQSALELDPKAVLFMGSAGGINKNTSVYDVSVPSEFVLNGKVLSVDNFIYEKLANAGTFVPGVFLGARHGHTNSPIEQTKAYVSEKIDAGIDTYDVEQNLIAEAVLNYNLKFKKNILFGAINLITDKPKSFHYDWQHDHDLSRVNQSQKAQARDRAVSLIISGSRAALSAGGEKVSRRCSEALAPPP